MSTQAFALTDSMTMLRRQLRHMQRYMGLTVMLVGMPVVFLLLFAYRLRWHAGRGPRRCLGRPGRLHQLRRSRDHHHRHRQRRPGNGDLGRHGHDRRHHRPIPNHGHLPALGADRSRPRQHDPDGARHRRRHRCRPGHRVPTHGRARRVDRRGRAPRDGHLGDDVAMRRARPAGEERGDGEQHPHAVDHPAVPEQRIRPDGHDAGCAPLVRRVSAVHAHHRDPAGTADGHADRQQCVPSPSRGAWASPWCASSGRVERTTATPFASEVRRRPRAG